MINNSYKAFLVKTPYSNNFYVRFYLNGSKYYVSKDSKVKNDYYQSINICSINNCKQIVALYPESDNLIKESVKIFENFCRRMKYYYTYQNNDVYFCYIIKRNIFGGSNNLAIKLDRPIYNLYANYSIKKDSCLIPQKTKSYNKNTIKAIPNNIFYRNFKIINCKKKEKLIKSLYFNIDK